MHKLQNKKQVRLHQPKKLYSKRNHQRNEKRTNGMGKIFADHISDKGLIFKIYNELIQPNSKNKQLKNGQWT